MEKGPSNSVPYGQACMPCFKSKCKCIQLPSGDCCERCFRLNKECYPSDSIRKRRTQRVQNPGTRIDQLEGKLETIVTLLQTVTSSLDASTGQHKALREETNASELQDPSFLDCDMRTYVSNITSGSQSHMPSASESLEMPFSMSGAEAEECFAIFRTRMLPNFPFIHLPPSITTQRLRQQRPLLFQTIMAMAAVSSRKKEARGREVRRTLIDAAYFDGVSNIDILLAILTYVTWSNDQYLKRMITLTRLMQLAVSLVHELRLNKPLPLAARKPGFFIENHEEDSEENGDCLEQYRAVLACFALSSMISSYIALMDVMPWTPQMEACLRTITSNRACPTDETFSVQIRLQLLAQKVVEARDLEEASTSSPSIFLYTKMFQEQLQELKTSLSPQLQQQVVIMTHVHYVELCICETAHSSNSDIPLAPPTICMIGFERLQCYWRSVEAIKSWLNEFFKLSARDCITTTFFFSAQISRCLMALYRLSTHTDLAWDCRAVRSTIDLLVVLDRVADMTEAASIEADEQSEEDVLLCMSKVMRSFRLWASVRMEPDGDGIYSNSQAPDFQVLQSFDFGNDIWMEEAFGRP